MYSGFASHRICSDPTILERNDFVSVLKRVDKNTFWINDFGWGGGEIEIRAEMH